MKRSGSVTKSQMKKCLEKQMVCLIFFFDVFISHEGFCSSIPHHSHDNHHVLCPEVQMDKVESVHGSDVTEEFFTPGMDFFNWY